MLGSMSVIVGRRVNLIPAIREAFGDLDGGISALEKKFEAPSRPYRLAWTTEYGTVIRARCRVRGADRSLVHGTDTTRESAVLTVSVEPLRL
jgi:hypothetical protein